MHGSHSYVRKNQQKEKEKCPKYLEIFFMAYKSWNRNTIASTKPHQWEWKALLLVLLWAIIDMIMIKLFPRWLIGLRSRVIIRSKWGLASTDGGFQTLIIDMEIQIYTHVKYIFPTNILCGETHNSDLYPSGFRIYLCKIYFKMSLCNFDRVP